MTAGVVLAHGAFHGPWCWERVQAHCWKPRAWPYTPLICAAPTTAEDIAAFQEDVNHMRARTGQTTPPSSPWATRWEACPSQGWTRQHGRPPGVSGRRSCPLDESGEDNPPDPYGRSGDRRELLSRSWCKATTATPRSSRGRRAISSTTTALPEDIAWAESQLRPQPLGQAPQPYASSRLARCGVHLHRVRSKTSTLDRWNFSGSCARLVATSRGGA